MIHDQNISSVTFIDPLNLATRYNSVQKHLKKKHLQEYNKKNYDIMTHKSLSFHWIHKTDIAKIDDFLNNTENLS